MFSFVYIKKKLYLCRRIYILARYTMRHRQKIAISRLISDLMKADDMICREEIALYNQIVSAYDITEDELYEAQSISLTDAVMYIQHMPLAEQKKIYSVLYKAAYSDKLCVAREALLLQTLSMVLGDTSGKYQLFSSNLKGWDRAEKYVVYVESDYMPAINDEILKQYDTIASMLQLWNFEFIYIPKFVQSLCEMDREYLNDIIRYTNPRISTEMLDKLYDRLSGFTTESFTTDYLAHCTKQSMLREIEPSLLVNVGWSDIYGTSASQQDDSEMNFLRIRLDDEEDSVLKEVKRFLAQYEQLITDSEYHRPKIGKQLFRYYGFYKQLFDFLARRDVAGAENRIAIDVAARRIWMRGVEIPMSATQLATYVFILHQSLCTHHGGLIKAGQHHPLSENDVQRLGRTYYAICKLFRDAQNACGHSYIEDVPNIRGYIARVRTLLEHHIAAQDINYYYPKDSADKSMYQILINPQDVVFRSAAGEMAFTEYPLWESLK